MRLSERYPVPRELALLYEFVNSLDLRCFVEQGAPHPTGDEIGTPDQLQNWMRKRDLLAGGATVSADVHRQALELRKATRDFIGTAPDARARHPELAASLSQAGAAFPVVVQARGNGHIVLEPAPGASGLGRVLAELHRLDEVGALDRLKMCASKECHWVFYDRSKPGNRRWCSSILCGNREKTRSYRSRKRTSATADGPLSDFGPLTNGLSQR
jgi:predicted RNA-binding Zn ribbon-like protein